MYCQNCGTENIAEAMFCSNCGAPLKKKDIKYCRFCKAENEMNAAFCNKCGTSFSETSPVNQVVDTNKSEVPENKTEYSKTKEFHFYWKGRFNLWALDVEIFFNDILIGTGKGNKGFDFVYMVNLSETKFHQVKIKIEGDKYFDKLVDFSRFRNGLVEFVYKDSLFSDSIVLKED